MTEAIDGVPPPIMLATPFLPASPLQGGGRPDPSPPAQKDQIQQAPIQQSPIQQTAVQHAPMQQGPLQLNEGLSWFAVLFVVFTAFRIYDRRGSLRGLRKQFWRLVSGGFELRVLEDGTVGPGPDPDETPYVTVRAGAALGTSVVMISQIMPISGPDWTLTWASACFFLSVPLLALVVYIQRFSGILALRWEARGYWWTGEVSFVCGLALVALHISEVAFGAFVVAAGFAFFVSNKLSQFIGELLASVQVETTERDGQPPVTRVKVWDANAPDPDRKE